MMSLERPLGTWEALSNSESNLVSSPGTKVCGLPARLVKQGTSNPSRLAWSSVRSACSRKYSMLARASDGGQMLLSSAIRRPLQGQGNRLESGSWCGCKITASTFGHSVEQGSSLTGGLYVHWPSAVGANQSIRRRSPARMTPVRGRLGGVASYTSSH